MHVMESAPGAETIIDGRTYLYFCGTGYLGLQGHRDLIAAACEATQRYGLGTATTRAGFGNSPAVVEVERRAAAFFGSEEAFYFASGYAGNHVLLSALAPSAHLLLVDEHSHYSVVDASRCFDMPVVRYSHADAQSLREALRQHLPAGQVPIVLSDGVFAARGTVAPVREYLDVLQEYPGAMLCLDDCHALGVLGEHGRGTYEYCSVPDRRVNSECGHGLLDHAAPRLYAVGTLSKAFGGYGGILSGTRNLIDSVKTMSHYFQGASAPPTPAAAASAAALAVVARTPGIITRVQENARSLKRQLRALGLAVDHSPVPIVSLELGDAENMQRIQRALSDEGILIAYMSRYSGLGSKGALRIAVFATHTEEMLLRLSAALGRQL